MNNSCCKNHFEACENDHFSCLQSFLSNGIDVNERNKDDSLETGVIVATRTLNKECLQLMIDSKADVNIADDEGVTGILYALLNHRMDLARTLIESKADLELKTIGGMSVFNRRWISMEQQLKFKEVVAELLGEDVADRLPDV